MWRMIGPHQALRLERIRTEVERDKFGVEDKVVPDISQDSDQVESTNLVESTTKQESEQSDTRENSPNNSQPSLNKPTIDQVAQSTDADGYEWWKGEDGINWYRVAGSSEDWIKFES